MLLSGLLPTFLPTPAAPFADPFGHFLKQIYAF
jgi:hypothetical protein